jgi:putative DNA primase/helicase
VEHDDSDKDGDTRRDIEQMLVDLLTESGGKMPAKQVKAEVSMQAIRGPLPNGLKKSPAFNQPKKKE